MINKESILEQIKQILSDILNKENLDINMSTTSNDVDGWDSLNHMIILAKIEKHFDVIFSFREVMKLNNVGDLCNIISTKL